MQTTAASRIEDNLAAIRRLKQADLQNLCESEKYVLAGFSGWGGLTEVFMEGNSHYDELKSMLTPEEYETAAASMLDSYYTPGNLIRQPGPASPRAVFQFEDLLLRIHEAEKAESRHVPYQSEELKALIRRIGAAPEKDWDFEVEADKFHVTSTHFRRIFKEMAGLPPQQYLLQMRLSKAAERLKNTSAPIKEIAALSGWENVFYFSRLFRQKYYISPLQYRKEFHS